MPYFKNNNKESQVIKMRKFFNGVEKQFLDRDIFKHVFAANKSRNWKLEIGIYLLNFQFLISNLNVFSLY